MKSWKSMRKVSWIVVFACMILLVACGKKEEYKPVAINEEVDTCEICNMQVADNEHATQIVQKEGKVLKFDDLGDHYQWLKKHGTDLIGAQYVRDLYSKEWIELEQATFVYDESFETPMAYGVYSFKSDADAQAFVEKEGKGKVLSLEDLESHEWKMNMDSHGDGHDHDHDHDDEHEHAEDKTDEPTEHDEHKH